MPLPVLSARENARMRESVAEAVGAAGHTCPRCHFRWAWKPVPGRLALSDREVEIVETTRELTIRTLAERGALVSCEASSRWRRILLRLLLGIG